MGGSLAGSVIGTVLGILVLVALDRWVWHDQWRRWWR